MFCLQKYDDESNSVIEMDFCIYLCLLKLTVKLEWEGQSRQGAGMHGRGGSAGCSLGCQWRSPVRCNITRGEEWFGHLVGRLR